VESISQREMRNNSGEVLRRVAEGESFLVTNRGVPTAVIAPAEQTARATLLALGRLTPGTGLDLDALPVAVEPIASTAQVLTEDRE
jgi:prevent-host-death family protein